MPNCLYCETELEPSKVAPFVPAGVGTKPRVLFISAWQCPKCKLLFEKDFDE